MAHKHRVSASLAVLLAGLIGVSAAPAQMARTPPEPVTDPDSPRNADLPPWVAEVRAQRRALAEQQRQHHEARRQRLIERLDTQRRALADPPWPPPPAGYAAYPGSWLGGPWFADPWFGTGPASKPESRPESRPESGTESNPDNPDGTMRAYPGEWNNLWYFRGW